MIVLSLTINNHLSLMSIKAVRMEPTGKLPKDGQLCKYSIYIDKKYAGQFIHPYGDGISLARKMMDHYDLWKMKENNNGKLS